MSILDPEVSGNNCCRRLFKKKQILVGVSYLAIGVCAIVAAWLVMNWLI